ncbi:MAG: hypothetical protein GY811_04065 [Myxococcales bacterium]|nr:hypothetical protein [Myxococcales bacterium]
MSNTINVANRRQAVLFHSELQGQISDGMWENTRPYGHYKCWCNAKAVVDPTNVGRDFYAEKDNYMLNGSELLDIVGERMMVAVRIEETYGQKGLKAFVGLFCSNGTFMGMPSYDGEYWAAKRVEITEMLAELHTTMEEISVVGQDTLVYNRKMLNADLRELRKIFKTQR